MLFHKYRKIITCVVILLFINIFLIQCISSENNIHIGEQQYEIKIYGSIRLRNIDKPWNQTDGVYAEAINLGPDIAYISIGHEMKTFSTVPFYTNEVLLENLEIQVGSVINIAIYGGFFGFGLLSYRVFIDGYGEDEGCHFEKTGYGICFGTKIIILFQN